MSLLIKNGIIVTAMDEFNGDILIDGEKIIAIGKDLKINADEIIDANNMYVMPGGVDQHVHFSFEFNGTKVRGFETSNAAAVGGTTTVIEFVNQVKGKGLIDSIDNYRKENAEGIAMVDYSFHGVITDPSRSSMPSPLYSILTFSRKHMFNTLFTYSYFRLMAYP